MLNINLKCITTKTDKYENEISYFAIETVDFDKFVKGIPENLKMPYWSGKESFLLKVKSKYLEGSEKG